MNLEQLLFTWKGRHLVLALFASNMLAQKYYFCYKYFQNSLQLLANELKRYITTS